MGDDAMTEQEQFDDTIKRLQDRLNAGGADAPVPGTADMLPMEEDIQRRIKADERATTSVGKQLDELPTRPGGADSRVLSFPAATLKAYASRRRSPAPTNLDVGPAMAALGPVGRTPENEADPMNLGVAPVPPPSDGDASDEPAPVAARTVIMPDESGALPANTDTLEPFSLTPKAPNKAYVADTVLETPRMLQREMGPPAPPPNPQMGPPREVMMPGEGQGDSPVGVPDKLLAEPAKPTENASPVAVAQAQKATPAVSIADTGGGDEDPEEAVKRYAANRAKGMSEILRIGNRFAAGIAGKKPDFGTADWLDKMEAGDEAALKAQADRAQKLREYAAQRADRERAFGLQERELKAKERPVARPGKTQEQIDAESRARLALMEAQRNKAMQAPAGGDGWGGDTGGAIEQFSPEAIDRLATFYNKTGGSLPPLGVGKTAASIRGRIISRAAEMAGAAGEPDLATAKAAFGADTGALRQASNLGAKIASSEGTVRGNMDVLREASKDLVRTPIPLVNKPLIWLQANVAGIPAASKFLNAIGTVTNEYSSVMTLNGSQGSTDAARAKAESMINQGLTDGTLGQVLDQMEQEMENRIRSNKATIAGIREGIGGAGPSAAVPIGTRKMRAGAMWERTESGWKKVQ